MFCVLLKITKYNKIIINKYSLKNNLFTKIFLMLEKKFWNKTKKLLISKAPFPKK